MDMCYVKHKQTSEEILQTVELVDNRIRMAMAMEHLLAMINLSQATHLFLSGNAATSYSYTSSRYSASTVFCSHLIRTQERKKNCTSKRGGVVGIIWRCRFLQDHPTVPAWLT
jgi:Zn-dependent oligopeptidase